MDALGWLYDLANRAGVSCCVLLQPTSGFESRAAACAKGIRTVLALRNRIGLAATRLASPRKYQDLHCCRKAISGRAARRELRRR